MVSVFRALAIGVFWIGAVFASLDVCAASLREMLDKNGRDYVIANAKTVATQIDDRDKYFLAQILIGNLRGSEAPEILIPIAQKGDLASIRVLAMNFGTGKEGFKTNRSQATLWTAGLEKIASGADEKQRKNALGALCEIYKDWNHVLYGKEIRSNRSPS